MKDTERPHDTGAQDDDQLNHIHARGERRQQAVDAIETLRGLYSNGVPTGAVVGYLEDQHDMARQQALDALDHLERMGDIYQVNECWKVVQP